MMSDLLDQLVLPSPIKRLDHPIFIGKSVQVWVKREDLIHPWVSGNKWRKLKYNLVNAIEQKKDTLITFGGAHSNHLYAVAGAAYMLGMKSIGLVRGESNVSNTTLDFCREKGMQLKDIPRSEYHLKEDSDFIQNILSKYSNAYLIPEGGTNELALKGVEEIWDEIHEQMEQPDYVICACGTGGTAAGLCLRHQENTKILAISVLKSDHLSHEIKQILGERSHLPYKVMNDYHFGGYAKMPIQLLDFQDHTQEAFDMPLDIVYNAKAFYGLMDMIKNNYFAPLSKILYINSGGNR